MKTFIRWDEHPLQEGFLGHLGSACICAVIPWEAEKDRWPWQLQILHPAFADLEFVIPARSSEEAQKVAGQKITGFLSRMRLAPVSDGVRMDFFKFDIAEFEDREAWLQETGWYDPIDLQSDDY